jgi:hypothetical protein
MAMGNKFTFHTRRGIFGTAVQLTAAHTIVYSTELTGYQSVSDVNWSTREFLKEVQRMKALVTPVQTALETYTDRAIFGSHSAKHVACILE